MRHPVPLLLILLSALLTVACTPSRRAVSTVAAHRADTARVTLTDTIRITIADTIRVTTTEASVTDATVLTRQRDSTVTAEVIRTTFDPSTGHPVQQVVERSTTQVADISSLTRLVARQQHTIDSLVYLNRTLSAAHHLDSLATHRADTLATTVINERGDASLTPFQTFIRHFFRTFSTAITLGFALLLFILAIHLYRTHH